MTISKSRISESISESVSKSKSVSVVRIGLSLGEGHSGQAGLEYIGYWGKERMVILTIAMALIILVCSFT